MNRINRLLTYLLLVFLNLQLSYVHANLSSQLLNEEEQRHRNAVVQITNPEGVLDATHSQSLTLDGGRITAPHAQGRIDHVTVTSHQDHATSSHSGFGFVISGTLATGSRGSAHVARGRSYERAVQEEAGLKIQDATEFSIGNLTVTGPTLDPNLASLADQVTFHPLKDKKGGWSFQGSLCNLDLSSPENFMQSLQQGVQQAVRSALAAELTHQAGGKGILPSAAGILAGLDHAKDGTTQDLNITGGFSFKDGQRDFNIPFVNINSKPTPFLSFLSDNQQDSQDSLENLERNILEALQQEGATEEEANTVLKDPDLNNLAQQGKTFQKFFDEEITYKKLSREAFLEQVHYDNYEYDRLKHENYELQRRQVLEEKNESVSTNQGPSASFRQPSTFLEEAINLTEQGGLALDNFAQKHPTLAKYAVMSLQMGLGGPTRYLVREAADYLGGDQVQEAKQAGVTYLSRQLNIPDQDVEVVTSSLNFGLSLFLNKAKGVLKDAQYVSKAVKDRSIALTTKPLDSQLTKRIEKNIKLSKEQPWVIRPGQEWKEKIIGKAQKTGTPGHAIASYRTAIKEAKKENVDKVYLNRGVKKATGENIGLNTRPDVSTVTKDGKVNQFEVPSKTDKPKELMKRMDTATEKFSSVKQGENKIVEIIKPKNSGLQ